MLFATRRNYAYYWNINYTPLCYYDNVLLSGGDDTSSMKYAYKTLALDPNMVCICLVQMEIEVALEIYIHNILVNVVCELFNS